MSSLNTIAVIGASLAGLRAVETLRAEGFDGRLVLVGAEQHLPYDRPPLSKEILQGKWEPEQTQLKKDGYEDLDLDLRLGRRALSLDPSARSVELDDGSRVVCDGLILATGASVKRPASLSGLGGVHYLRTLDDALAIGRGLEDGPRVAVVGAGFIGAEVAASCRARGLEVTLIDPLPTPMSAGLGTEMGAVCARLHADSGVDLRMGVGVEALFGKERVQGLRLGDGSRVDADLVVVGVGVTAETAWLESSGIGLDDGVVCDAHCRSSIEWVFAAGDVARWYNPRYGRHMRVEHWTNAVGQGVAAARNLLAGTTGASNYHPVPTFWSDQHGVKIQFAGTAAAGDQVRVVHGSTDENRFVAFYGNRGSLSAVLTFRRPRLSMLCSQWLEEGMSWDNALERAAAEL